MQIGEQVDVVVIYALEKRIFADFMLSVKVHIGLIYETILKRSSDFIFKIMLLIFATTLAIFFFHFLEAVDTNVLLARSLVHEYVAPKYFF
mgnify:CR=1 FL=1